MINAFLLIIPYDKMKGWRHDGVNVGIRGTADASFRRHTRYRNSLWETPSHSRPDYRKDRFGNDSVWSVLNSDFE